MRIAKIPILILCLTISACNGNYPRDPENSLEKAKRKSLRVGIAESKELSNYNNGNPSGIEVELIKGYAQSINAEIEWIAASQQEIGYLLKEFQLDIGIGGFTKTTPWKKHVGLTRPYSTEKIKVAVPKGEVVPEEIEDKQVVVKKGSSALAAVKKKKGIPVLVNSLTKITQLTAAPEEELKKMEATISEYDLIKVDHVVVIPKGENALLKSLENYIHSEWKNREIKKSL